MSRFMSLASLAVVASAALFAVAQQAVPKVASVPIQQTPVSSGRQMYATYCASCHGASANGDGPAAPALKFPPTDLTTLSKKNGGVFPSDRIVSVLQFGVEAPAHPDVLVHQRIANLTDYLKKIQK